jgi:hypothetical protein
MHLTNTTQKEVPLMADSITQPDTNETEPNSEQALKENEQDTQAQQPNTPEVAEPTPANVIWTPRFIIIFTLILVFGLSTESLLVRGWENHFYAEAWISFGHIALIVGCLIAVIVVTHSHWVRLGSIFGIVWAIFMSISQALTFYTLAPGSPLPAHVNAPLASALLGMYMCFSVERTPLRRWDSWFFRLMALIVIVTVGLAYLVTHGSLALAESAASAVLLVFCVLVWWSRPSCWRTQPGPTFLLGLMPALLLVMALPGVGVGGQGFFLLQLALFAVLLGVIRILQGEARRRK